MKSMRELIWLMQLGFSVAVTPLLCILLAVWLRNRFELGVWIIIIGVVCGILGAVSGLRSSLKNMFALHKNDDQEDTPVSFNDHD